MLGKLMAQAIGFIDHAHSGFWTPLHLWNMGTVSSRYVHEMQRLLE
jgi:hypothetical protein